MKDQSINQKTPVNQREEILAALTGKLGIRIQKVIKYSGDKPQYRLVTDQGEVHLPMVNDLITQSRLRPLVAAATGRYLRSFHKDEWPSVAQLLLQACEEVDRGDDATTKGVYTDMLRTYTGEHPPHEEPEDAIEGDEPFTRGGEIYIRVKGFLGWVRLQPCEQLLQGDVTAQLRVLGAEPVKVDATVDGKRTTRSYWRLPAGLLEDPPDEEDRVAA